MILSLFESVQKAYLLDAVDDSWEEIQSLLVEFNRAEAKDQVMLFNLWQFKTIEQGATLARKNIYKDGAKTGEYKEIPNTVRRSKENVIGVWGIVLDYDGGKTIEQAMEELNGLEYVLFTTFNHTQAVPKFRVVLPFDSMLTQEEFLAKQDDITQLFAQADTASFSMSQSFYLHSGADPSTAVAFRNKGEFISGSMFESKAAPVIAPARDARAIVGSFQLTESYKNAVANALLSCSGVRRGAAAGNGGALTLASICKSIELSYEEFAAIVDHVAAADSTLRTDPALKRSTWNDCTVTHISRQKRDEFIKQHGGKALVTGNLTAEEKSAVKVEKQTKTAAIIDKYSAISARNYESLLNKYVVKQ